MSAVGAGLRTEDSPDLRKRALVLVLVLLAIITVAILLFKGDGGYRVTAEFVNAGQLVKGNEVKAGGVAVGSVKDIDVTQDGRAKVTLGITDEDYQPLRRGTQVMVKQASLSGIANRYVDLHLGPANGEEIEDGGVIGTDETNTAVELDQIFALFDDRTRTGLQDFFKGSAQMLRGRGKELRRGVHYLNPALSTGARLFQELTRDEALLERFLVDSGTLVNALAERRDDLTGVVGNLNATFGALGRQQDALAESVERLPPFMRRANTTFVNLRSALDDVDPFVDASKPAVRRLGPFLDQARLFVRDGEPTIRDLSRTIGQPGRRNDLIELIRSFPPLARVAMDERRRERREPARRLPGDDRRSERRRADDRLRPPVHARLRGLDGRLLHHRRLRRPRRLLASLDQPLGDPLRPRAEGAPVPPLPGRQRGARGRRQQRLHGRAGRGARL